VRYPFWMFLAVALGGVVFGQAAGPIKDAPFSALWVTIGTQVAADGKSSETRESRRVYRDSSGRIREDLVPGFTDDPSNESPAVMIRDSVTGIVYVLETPTRVAHKIMPPTLPSGAVQGAFYGYNMPFPANDGRTPPPPKGRPDVKSEALGTRAIQGIEAQGSRTTLTWSAASQGTERDVVSIDEKWIARELGMALVMKRSDARSGTKIMQLEKIERAEPDASLFMVPADYQMVDMPLDGPPQN